jgi:hypothetical protein
VGGDLKVKKTILRTVVVCQFQFFDFIENDGHDP